jgi:ADP-heptose:LPS heptosyltransferase
MQNIKKILISRTDKLGDLVLTLPLAAFLKNNFPQINVSFLVRDYALPIASSYNFIDNVYSFDQIDSESQTNNKIDFINSIGADAIIFAYPDYEVMRLLAKSNISIRVATSHRFYSFKYANKLVDFSRKKSFLHEAQLNFFLLKPLQINYIPSITELIQFYGKDKFQLNDLPDLVAMDFLDPKNRPIIIHPGSMGSAPNFSSQNFYILAKKLLDSGEKVYITGSSKEGQYWLPIFSDLNVKTFFGSLDLYQLMSVLANAKAVIASSTGPLHIAAALGTNVIGLYVPVGTYAPHRWAPIGRNANVILPNFQKINCHKYCLDPRNCECINQIELNDILKNIF